MDEGEVVFDVRVEHDGGPPTVVYVSGEVDLASAPQLRQALLGLVEADTLDVVVDASGLTFIDSAGLSVLLMASKRWAERKATLTLRAPSQPLRRLLELTATTGRFQLEP